MECLLDELILRLEDMEHAEYMAKIHKLEEESLNLQREIYIASKRLSTTAMLLKEATKLLHISFSVAQAHDGKKTQAESAWGSYWGIVRQCNKAVDEMESIAPHLRPMSGPKTSAETPGHLLQRPCRLFLSVPWALNFCDADDLVSADVVKWL